MMSRRKMEANRLRGEAIDQRFANEKKVAEEAAQKVKDQLKKQQTREAQEEKLRLLLIEEAELRIEKLRALRSPRN